MGAGGVLTDVKKRVTVVGAGLVNAESAQTFAAQQLAALTHLPTGATSGWSQTVTIAPGSDVVTRVASDAETLLHVAAGQLTVTWGAEPAHRVTAGPGDTVIVRAGTAVQFRNGSAVDPLQLVVLLAG